MGTLKNPKIKVAILRGEGIECEKESLRYFIADPFFEPSYVDLPELSAKASLESLSEKLGPTPGLIFLPGGFSYADHYGSGRLLASELRHLGFMQFIKKHSHSVLGVCNGFQTLCCLDVFGKVSLLANESSNQSLGFINRWVSLDFNHNQTQAWRMSVRHGEGRISYEGSLGENIRPFLKYTDEYFDNGSKDRIAGLIREDLNAAGLKSFIIGLMPHPEVSYRPYDNPDYVASETKSATETSGYQFREWLKNLLVKESNK